MISKHRNPKKDAANIYLHFLISKFLTQNKDFLTGLNRDDLISISQDNNIIRSADLLSLDDIRNLIRR